MSTQEISTIEEAIKRSADSRIDSRSLMEARSDKELLKSALALFEAQPDASSELSPQLFKGKPTIEAFHARLHRLQLCLGFENVAYSLVGILGSGALRLFTNEELISVLRSLVEPHELRENLCYPILPHILANHSFATGVLVEILPEAGANQQCSRFYTQAIEIMAKNKPKESASIVAQLMLQLPDEKRTNTAQYLLGLTRAFHSQDKHLEELSLLEESVTISDKTHVRIIGIRSWNATSWTCAIGWEPFSQLIKIFESTEGEEKKITLSTICSAFRSPFIDEITGSKVLQWLESISGPELSPTFKPIILALIGNTAYFNEGFCIRELPRLVELWIRILCRGEETEEYWNQVDPVLHELLNKNEELLYRMLVALAHDNLGKLKHALKNENRNNRMFLWGLAQKNCTDFVHGLILEDSAGSRRLGLYLFEELSISEIDTSFLEARNESTLIRLIEEIRRRPLHGECSLSLLLSLLTQADRCSETYRRELEEEILAQAKNLPGKLLPVLEKIQDSSMLVKKVVEEANAYFERFRNARKHPALQMRVPGYGKAVALYQKRFSRSISEYVDENSLFSFFAHKVILLYGHRHSSFSGGKLGDATPLEHVSHSEEFPRIEFIEPEMQALRRLQASNNIGSFEGNQDER
jgi:hypothetical protein